MKLAFKLPIAAIAAGLLYSGGALAQQPPTPTPSEEIEPEAVEALKRMSAYLGTLTAFEVTANSTSDIILDDGEKIQFAEKSNFKVQRPNNFVVERTSDYKNRRLFYDGKKLTLYSPKTSYYAQVDAPPTIKETITAVSDKYGIELPLTDLFRWSEPGGDKTDQLKSAFHVGTATIGGVATDQYAFRGPDVDWQIWISQGPNPTPRRIVIIDREDDSRPQYTADLTWNTKPAFNNATFAFQAPADAKPIRMTALDK